MAEVPFFGEALQLHPEGVSDFAIMEFAEAADADAESTAGIGAQLRLIESGLVDEDEAAKFRRLARKNRASTKDLAPLVAAVMEAKVERPTSQPSDSTDGQDVTPPQSAPSLEDKVFEAVGGRADLYAVQMEALENTA